IPEPPRRGKTARGAGACDHRRMRSPVLRLVLAYGALAAVVLVGLRLVSLAPLRFDWGRELLAAATALAGAAAGLGCPPRPRAAARLAAGRRSGGSGLAEPARAARPGPARRRTQQQGDRARTRRLGEHGQDAPRPSVRQARRPPPHRGGRGGTPRRRDRALIDP